jgi:hypothetical protein
MAILCRAAKNSLRGTIMKLQIRENREDLQYIQPGFCYLSHFLNSEEISIFPACYGNTSFQDLVEVFFILILYVFPTRC